MRLKHWIIGIAAVIVIPIAVVAWWLLSPLFIDKTVDEDLPFARSAVVPAGMTPGEVEQIMAGMAKVNQEVDEPMPAEMMTSPGAGNTNAADATATQPAAVGLKQGAFQDADNFTREVGGPPSTAPLMAPICFSWKTLWLPTARTYMSFSPLI